MTRYRELASVQKRSRAGEEHERRRAEVRDPAGEKDSGGRPAGGDARIHPNVIDRHQDHHRAADDVE